MKRLIVVLLLLASVGQAAQQDYVEQLNKFYANQAKKPERMAMLDSVTYTLQAAQDLCIEAQVDTMLAMWHRESDFDKRAVGLPGEDSAGIAQTRKKDIPKWRAFWLGHGIDIGNFNTIRAQCYCGVSEFYGELQLSHGSVKEAVRRYNGGGAKARLYSRRVMVSRKVIFGRFYHPGEYQAVGCH